MEATKASRALYAHSRNHAGRRHLLLEHLESVAEMARDFAIPFGGGDLAWWSGIWHDAGKFHPEFQQYLSDAEALPRLHRRGPDHKAAGARLAQRHGDLLAHLIVGHHGGLRDTQTELRPWLSEKAGETRVDEALAIAAQSIQLLEPSGALSPPSWAAGDPLAAEFFIRMLFSTLVDADFLDTEAHFSAMSSPRRSDAPSIPELAEQLEEAQDRLSGRESGAVNEARHAVYLDCLRAAAEAPGFFRLTVPTGGGKTRSGLAFALRHAVNHNLRRVIVAIPYTSITDQTAADYRSIFRSDRAVLEHHSAIERGDDEDVGIDIEWERLAAENWDAPIVVTTTVQLFESLLGRSTSACRKLHNIAGSVIVLDEVQSLPEKLLAPILDTMRELVARYRVTVALSTATQPGFDDSPSLQGLPNIREIVDRPERHFARLRRVNYDWTGASDGAWDWERVAREVRESEQALAILNTKANALSLLDALDDPDALHLSTLLCGAHRRDVLAEVRRRLVDSEPCRLVATQVVEAGVDLDFPLVLRAVGPLDRIVQAAGRCNREGRLEAGRVVVFQPADGGLPTGAYRTGADITSGLLARADFDFHDPAVYRAYFSALHARVNPDSPGIQAMRARIEYRAVASAFRFIDDDTVSVLVGYRDTLPDGRSARGVVDDLRNHRGNPRDLWRALQPLMVNVRSRQLAHYARQALAVEVVPGLWEWMGAYDPVRGLVGNRLNPDNLVI